MLEKITRALQARADIRAADTDALRIVDGYGDGLDGIAIDDFAGHWLVETKAGAPFPNWLLGGKEGENLEIRKSGKEGGSLPDFLISRLNSASLPIPHSIYWKKLGEKESPQWIAGRKIEEPFVVSENGVKYWIDFASGYSQGIFLDQRDNRLALRKMSQGRTVLNCFAYTCAFGVCAALGGASTVNLDLSKRYLEWGKRNYALNGLPASSPEGIRGATPGQALPTLSGRSDAQSQPGSTLQERSLNDFIYGDVADWLRRFAKKGRKFDIILLDPPTFSRNDKGAIFTIEDGFTPLVQQALALLNPRGTLFCSTNQRTLSPAEFRRLITDGVEDLENYELRFAPMPADFKGEDYLKTWWMERAG